MGASPNIGRSSETTALDIAQDKLAPEHKDHNSIPLYPARNGEGPTALHNIIDLLEQARAVDREERTYQLPFDQLEFFCPIRRLSCY